MSSGNRKKFKNSYAKWSKKSPYKTLQLLECFARDLPVREAARLTKMTERTVRDRFAELRMKLLQWVTDYPDRFNGFGHLLLDPDGTINIHVLEVLIHYSQSEVFKQRMAKRYPRFRTAKDAALNHVIELAVRRFTSTELPKLNQDFLGFVKNTFAASKTQTYFQSLKQNYPASKIRLHYWKNTSTRMSSQDNYRARRFPNADGEAFFRDLRYCLRNDPL